jgi:hypothetical protein
VWWRVGPWGPARRCAGGGLVVCGWGWAGVGRGCWGSSALGVCVAHPWRSARNVRWVRGGVRGLARGVRCGWCSGRGSVVRWRLGAGGSWRWSFRIPYWDSRRPGSTVRSRTADAGRFVVTYSPRDDTDRSFAAEARMRVVLGVDMTLKTTRTSRQRPSPRSSANPRADDRLRPEPQPPPSPRQPPTPLRTPTRVRAERPAVPPTLTRTADGARTPTSSFPRTADDRRALPACRRRRPELSADAHAHRNRVTVVAQRVGAGPNGPGRA